MQTKGNILLCGLGGQGVLLASEIIALSLLQTGLCVKKSEIHGMAQRGGSVFAHIRYGQKVYSPVIERGMVDIEVAFETMEAVRYLPFLNQSSRVLVNTQKIPPAAITTGREPYPDDVLNELRNRKIETIAIDCLALARESGDVRSVNMVLVGALSFFLPLPEEIVCEQIKQRLPMPFVEANLKAFQHGRVSVSPRRSAG